MKKLNLLCLNALKHKVNVCDVYKKCYQTMWVTSNLVQYPITWVLFKIKVLFKDILQPCNDLLTWTLLPILKFKHLPLWEKKAALKSRLKVSSLKKAHTYLRRGISDHTKYINMSKQYIRVLQQGTQHLHVQNVTARGSVTAVLFCFLNLKCVFTY